MGFIAPYVLKMVDALEPMYLVPLLLGLWTGRRLLRRADQQIMLAFCATCFAAVGAFWYLVHDIQGRYFFPIVLVSSNYAALGVCRLSELVSLVGGRWLPASNRRYEWATVVVLSAAMVIGCTDAFTTRYKDRVARRDLGEWILAAFGPGQAILGSEPRGWTIAWYAQARYYGPALEEIGAPSFQQQVNVAPPSVILINTRGGDVAKSDWYRRLNEQSDLLSQYRPAPNECLPASAQNTLVLVREAAWEQIARQRAEAVNR
jgi:hypothetical protein